MLDKVTFTLSSVESAILLNELYDKEFMSDNTPAAKLISGALYNEAECIHNHTSLSTLTEIYLKYDIKRFYNLSIDEFIDRDKNYRTILIDKAIEKMAIITNEANDIESQSRQLLQRHQQQQQDI